MQLDKLWRMLVLPCLAAAPALAGPQAGTEEGAVFAMDNDPTGNRVITYVRTATGQLIPWSRMLTGGLGTGQSLGSQGALTLSRNLRWLFAVNAGSDQLSTLQLTSSAAMLISVLPSGGDMPVSVASHNGLVYVLHAGEPDLVTGFRQDAAGQLQPIPDSTRVLSETDAQPAQIGFDPAGEHLVITLKALDQILVFDVGRDGSIAQEPRVEPSSGSTPFGFAFRSQEFLIVSEAFDDIPQGSAVSSYRLADTLLQPLTVSSGTGQTSACWIAIPRSLPFAYTSNTGSHTITGYAVSLDGELTLLSTPFAENGVTARTGKAPTDLAVSANGQFLYVLNSGSGSISAFSIQVNGDLVFVQEASGLPTVGAAGLAAF